MYVRYFFARIANKIRGWLEKEKGKNRLICNKKIT